MFADMEKQKAAAAGKRTAKGIEHHKKETPATVEAWSALISAITNDVNEFNNHKDRSGETPVWVFNNLHSHCEVYLPGLQSKRLVLTLKGTDLEFSVHPDFPKQESPITIELDKEGRPGSWVLGDSTKENSKISVERLSEYLLKPVLSSAAISQNREA